MPIYGVVIRFTKQCDVNHESIYQLGGVQWGRGNGISFTPRGFHGIAMGSSFTPTMKARDVKRFYWGKNRQLPLEVEHLQGVVLYEWKCVEWHINSLDFEAH